MTCIVGIKEKTRVVIGGDSIGVCGSLKIKRGDDKVFRRDDFLFGCCGDFRIMQVLKYHLKIPKLPTELEKNNNPNFATSLHEWIVTKFITELQKTLKTQTFDDEGEKPSLLIGYKNQLYEIAEDYQVAVNRNGLYAIGSGQNFAYGALDILQKDLTLTAEQKVKRALKASGKYCTTVLKPFTIMST